MLRQESQGLHNNNNNNNLYNNNTTTHNSISSMSMSSIYQQMAEDEEDDEADEDISLLPLTLHPFHQCEFLWTNINSDDILNKSLAIFGRENDHFGRN